MPFFAALSVNPDTAKAVEEVCKNASAALGGPANLGLIFFSSHHADYLAREASTLQERLGVGCLLGCSSESIVGNEKEIERQPALSLWLGRWPQPVMIKPFDIGLGEAQGDSFAELLDGIAGTDPGTSVLLLLGDPSSFHAAAFLEHINERVPGLPAFGGMASGGREKPGNCLIRLPATVSTQSGSAAVGVLLTGIKGVRSIVSHGCQPIGKTFFITRAQDQTIYELDGKSPLLLLQELHRGLNPGDQRLFQQGLHIGWHTDAPGGFLVRTPVGMDQASGAVTVNDRVAKGQNVQFMVLDPASADEELHRLLQKELGAWERKPGGALLFTCKGRGSRLFSQPNHDAAVLRAEAGSIPVAGFFADGEFGPIGGRNFLHTHTATVVLFGDESRSPDGAH
jgi:small ligand-binding sensory domain FIST